MVEYMVTSEIILIFTAPTQWYLDEFQCTANAFLLNYWYEWQNIFFFFIFFVSIKEWEVSVGNNVLDDN